MTEPSWLAIARSDIGLREGVGAADNPRVLAMFADAGHPEIVHDATAWCAAATGSWLKRAGLKGTNQLSARSYEKWGQSLSQPMFGCIGVKKRAGGAAWQGHVGLVVAANATTVWLLGGNTGDMVKVAAFPRKDFTAFRWPAEVAIPANPPPLPSHFAAGGATEA